MTTNTPDKNNYSNIDDLLANPFDDAITTDGSKKVQEDLAQASLNTQRAFTNERLIDRLPDHRKQQAKALAKQIDETNASAVLAYGANAQKKLSEFSHQFLQDVRVKDAGEVGDALTQLMTQLKATDPKELTAKPNLFKKWFGRVRQSLTETQLKYQQISSQIDKVAIRLEREKQELMNDNQMLDQLYDKNKDYFEALNVYIAAGELKLQELQNDIIPAAIEKAKTDNDQMAVQKVHDLNQFFTRLDKRTHDLRLTRQMTIQQAPQIRMIQNTNQALAEKIQVSVHTAIPLWENQITIALTLLRQQQAATSQRMVSETTNDLLLKNAQMLKQSAVDIAKEVERGVIDLETLQHSQRNLIETLEETMTIQEEGRQQRRAAEQELIKMENELRDNLLAISQAKKEADMQTDWERY